MAPELITGTVRAGEGPRLDLYALGILLYQLATFRLPFYGDTLDELFSAHVHLPIPDLCAERDDVSAAFGELVRERRIDHFFHRAARGVTPLRPGPSLER